MAKVAKRILPTTHQKVVSALEQTGGKQREAAELLGMSTRRLQTIIRFLRENGEQVPDSPHNLYPKYHPEAEPGENGVYATSTLIGPDGELKLQWVKKQAEGLTIEKLSEQIKMVFADCKPVDKIPAPKAVKNQLCVVIPIGDHHVGMYAWGEEAGQDYDVDIAANLLVRAAHHLIEVSPDAEVCIIAQVGDFHHYDSHRAETPLNKNALDADTRYAAMIRAGVSMMRVFIDAALAKYPKVRVVNSQGNHDPIGALWLSLALDMYYSKNPRVDIDTSPAKFVYHHHGSVLLGITHGDTCKLDKLPGVMATDQAALWGTTQHRYWLCGHIHQRKVLEYPGVMVETFRTLAPRDAWATAAGYRSGRDMTSIVFHRKHGEIARHRFDVSMMEEQ